MLHTHDVQRRATGQEQARVSVTPADSGDRSLQTQQLTVKSKNSLNSRLFSTLVLVSLAVLFDGPKQQKLIVTSDFYLILCVSPTVPTVSLSWTNLCRCFQSVYVLSLDVIKLHKSVSHDGGAGRLSWKPVSLHASHSQEVSLRAPLSLNICGGSEG